MEVACQRLNPSYTCDLHHSCGNTGSLTHCTRPGSNLLCHKDTRFLTCCTTMGIAIYFWFCCHCLWGQIQENIAYLLCCLRVLSILVNCILFMYPLFQAIWATNLSTKIILLDIFYYYLKIFFLQKGLTFYFVWNSSVWGMSQYCLHFLKA